MTGIAKFSLPENLIGISRFMYNNLHPGTNQLLKGVLENEDMYINVCKKVLGQWLIDNFKLTEKNPFTDKFTEFGFELGDIPLILFKGYRNFLLGEDINPEIISGWKGYLYGP